jgi:hypothetical protein
VSWLVGIVIIALALHCIDFLQTLTIAKLPDQWYEKANPILGKHPPPLAVKIYFALIAVVLVLLIWLAIALDYRGAAFLIALAWAGVEGWAVVHNWRLGIRV